MNSRENCNSTEFFAGSLPSGSLCSDGEKDEDLRVTCNVSIFETTQYILMSLILGWELRIGYPFLKNIFSVF